MRSRLLVPLTTAALLATGCSALTENGGDTEDGQVAVGFYPLEYVVDRVGGDHFDVLSLTSPGQEAHDATLDIATTATVSKAGLVVFLSGFQPAVDSTVEQNANGRLLDVNDVISLRAYGEDEHEGHDHGDGHEGHDHGADEHDDHADEESHAEDDHDADDHEGHDHDHGDFDPHFWLDPLLLAEVAEAVADELSELDPDHADEFATNLDALRTDLETLDSEYSDGLASCERDTVVVNHDAFGYLIRYGLHFEDIVGLSPGAEATIADQHRLQKFVRDEGITTVFSERLASAKSAQTLADDAGVRLEILDPLEGLSDQTADEDYLSLMRTNLTKLQEANGC